jgi:hypothetical protein
MPTLARPCSLSRLSIAGAIQRRALALTVSDLRIPATYVD